MSDIKLKEQLKIYSKEKIINILIDFINVCHKQEDIIYKAIEYIESYMPNYDFDKTNLIKVLKILRGVDKE